MTGSTIMLHIHHQCPRLTRSVDELGDCRQNGRPILLDAFNDVKEGDIIEAFETREIERTTLDQPPAATASAS